MAFDSTDPEVLAIWASRVVADVETRDEWNEAVIGLFDRYRAPMLRYLWSLGISAPDGEEVIQEVFLLLYQHLRRGKSGENLRGWLFGAAHNLALKRRSRNYRERTLYAEISASREAADPDPNPERQAAAKQDRVRLQAVVHALPALDRQCLALRAEGLRYREIARVLEISLGAVALSLTRSLARLARAMRR